MCYICQPYGDPAAKTIAAALKVWRRKKPTDRSRQAWSGLGLDWTKAPAKGEDWTDQANEAYQRRTRYNKLSGYNAHPSWGDTHNWSPYD